MACYWGCSSSSNKVVWSFASILFLAGAGLLIAWGVLSKGCIEQAKTCAESKGLKTSNLFDGYNLNSIRNLTLAKDDPAAAFCDTILPENRTACKQCYDVTVGCFIPSIGLFAAGIIALIISIIICPCWCIWCSKNPNKTQP